MIHQPPYRLFADIGICHDKIRQVQLTASFLQPLRRDAFDDIRIRNSCDHLTTVIMDTKVHTGTGRRLPFGQVNIDTLLLAVIMQQTAEQVTAEDGQ